MRENKRLPIAEKQAHLLFRKSLISQILREALREKNFPKALHTLTLKGFTKILDRRFIKSGLFSTEFHDALKLFCFIVQSVQPIDSIQELHQIFERIPRFIAKTRSMLSEIYTKSDTRKLLSGLEGFYLEKARSFKQKLDDLDTEPVFEMDGNSYTAFDENSDHIFKRCLAAAPSPAKILSDQPSYLKSGSWFDIDTGQDTRLHRLKLISILENTAQLIFLNISDNEIMIRNTSEFIEQINCERSRKLDVQHLFDKALAIAITNIQLSKN